MAINPNVIFMTIGASNSGKTYYCKNVLIPQLKNNYIYISSDDCRRELLNDFTLDKYDIKILPVSSQAFELLYKKLELAMTFPIAKEFIIVDSKGTSEVFRNKIYELAKEHNYRVVPIIFNYKNFEDYKKFSPMTDFTRRDILKTRESLSGLRKNPVVEDIIYIKSIDFSRLSDLEFSDKFQLLDKCRLANDRDYLIISDIHGCYKELVELLDKSGIKINQETKEIENNEFDKEIIIAGDYIDSGNEILEVIDFIYQNRNKIKLVIGNHEHRLYKELIGELEHIDEIWYNTYDQIKDNKEMKSKFIDLFENYSYPFFKTDRFIVTHAPCQSKYLGRVDNKSLVNQRYYHHSENREISLIEELNQIHLFDNNLSYFYHIFGHIPAIHAGANIQNRILIDGACSMGRLLISLEVSKTGYLFRKEVKSSYPEVNPVKFKIKNWKDEKKEEEINLEDLTYEENYRINQMIKNKVNYLSGTMTPCDKFNDELESIESAIDYFKSRGVTDVVIQRKYMGSRCNMYLFSTNEESFCISRNGFRIKDSQLADNQSLNIFYDKMRTRLKEFITKSDKPIKCIIIDGELMPWRAISEGLIKDFYRVSDCSREEIEFLKESGFEEELAKFESRFLESNFSKNKSKMNKKELVEFYGNLNFESFRSYEGFKYISTEDKLKMIENYENQLKIYGNKDKLDFKPFMILKIIFEDNSEINYLTRESSSNYEIFNLLNEDQCFRFNLLEEDSNLKIKELFLRLTEEERLEGIVIKPDRVTEERVVPYMKVRNPNYLSLIYGFDYLDKFKYEELLKRKSIKNKTKICEREWELGKRLLDIPYESIGKSNKELIQIYLKFIREESKEKELDPRL